MTPQDYFTAHSLKETFLKERGWEWDQDKITIPIFDPTGKFIFNKYRQLNGDTKFTADPGSHPALYCAEHIKELSEVVLSEGEPDCIRLWQEGIPAVTGTFGVGTFTASLAQPLKGKKVYVCLDTDKPGQENVLKYCQVLEEAGALPFIIRLPPEYKDVSEYLSDNHTKEEFNQFKKTTITKEEWEEEHIPEEWQLECGTELMDRELPPEDWLIDRVIPSEGFTFIVGAEATGKSFYTLTLAHSITTGQPWLGVFPVIKQTNVLFIDKENSARRRKSRIKGLSITSGLSRIHWIKQPHFFELLDNKSQISPFAHHLSKQVQKLNIGLIIIDSFTDVMIGNENASGDVQVFFDAMRQLFPTQAILVLHHENKPSQGISRTSSQRVRGSTNITAQIVSGFRVFPLPKTTNEFVLEQFKAGDAERLKPFKIELISRPSMSDPTKTVVCEIKHNGEYYDQEGQAELAEELITDFLTEVATSSRQDIIDHCMSNGVGQRTVCTVLTKMHSEGLLEKIKDGKTTNYLLKE